MPERILEAAHRAAKYTWYLAYRGLRSSTTTAVRAVEAYWLSVMMLVIGITIGHFGPGLYTAYAPWAAGPDATTDHVWVGTPVVSKDGVKVGTVHSVIAAGGWGDRKATPPRSIYVKEMRGYVYPQTRNLAPPAYKFNANEKRIVLTQTAAAHRARQAESWRPHWWSDKYWPTKNYWPGNWDWSWNWPW